MSSVEKIETGNAVVEGAFSEDSKTDEIAIVDEVLLRDKIYSIRGQKVMLDFELAEIYGYSTSRFNEQVRNNRDKFEDEDFMFQLTPIEFKNLKSIFSTSSWGGRRKLPFAFTEQGVYMLMTVLRGNLATRQSKALIRLFKRMKDQVIENQGLIGQREFLMLSMQTSSNVRDIVEMRLDLRDMDDRMAQVVNDLAETVTKSELSEMVLDFGKPAVRRGYFLLNGNPVEANLAYAEIYGRAESSVYVIDNYIGMKTLVLLKNVPEGVPVLIFSDNKGRGLHSRELRDFIREYPSVDVQIRNAGGLFHDRYIVLDYGLPSEKLYHCGASSKDAGERATTIEEVSDREAYHKMIDKILKYPPLELPE